MNASDRELLIMMGFSDGSLDVDFNLAIRGSLFERVYNEGLVSDESEELSRIRTEIRQVEEAYCSRSYDLVDQFNYQFKTNLLDELFVASCTNSFGAPEGLQEACVSLRETCKEAMDATDLETDWISETRKSVLEHTRQTAKSIVRIRKRKLWTETGGSKRDELGIPTWDGYIDAGTKNGEIFETGRFKNVGNPVNVLRSPGTLLNYSLGSDGGGGHGKGVESVVDFMRDFFNSDGTNVLKPPGNKEKTTRKDDDDEPTRKDPDEFSEDELENDVFYTDDGELRWPTLDEIVKARKKVDGRIESEEEEEDDELEEDGGNRTDPDDQDEAARVAALESGTLDTNNLTGDDRLEMFRQVLDLFQWEREDNQIDFHEVMIQTVLPKIFADEWDTDYERILRMFQVNEHNAETFIICPRRYGKTVSVAMFCAAYMFMIPNATIAIFSTSKRTAGKMMTAIYAFMRDLPFFDHVRFETKNSECIELYLNGNKREMWCYPGTVAVSIFSRSFFPSVLSIGGDENARYTKFHFIDNYKLTFRAF